MGRDEGEEKSKCRRIEFTKEARVACNFCEFSSGRFELRRHEQDQEAVCMERELERLRLLTRRMTGKDLDGLSFAELQLLESQLKGVLLIVKDQKKKVELEEDGRMCKQKQKARDEDGTRGELSAPCIFSARSSSGERPQKQGDEAPVPLLLREFERQNAESMESEFERLWLLNEKMSGRSLDGMTFFELLLLEGQILDAISSVKDQKLRPGIEQYARLLQEESISLSAAQERCSLDIVKDRRVPLRFRSPITRPSVSRKLRRFHNRRYRKTTPDISSVCQSRVASD